MVGETQIQAMKLSANSADFRDFLVISEISINLERTLKGYMGGGGTSTTTWPTEMVDLSKFAEFQEEMCGSLFKTVSLCKWQILGKVCTKYKPSNP